ncbi:DUF2341 domain-containing protein, partial [Patescibacteria group bacterium]|nr:DUF2341 domain-containing protein [Patescibacteria group bacterium]
MLPLQTHAQAWCDTDWLNRKKITVSNTNVDSDLTDFSLLINITDSDLSSVANSDGLDIFFTEETTCDKLKWEKEAYTSGTGALVAWVKVPTITAAANTILYMYYGNSGAADQTDFENVWTSDYKLVLHMEEDPSITTDGECGGGSVNFCDSTSNNNDGNASGTMVSGNLVPVQVSQGIDFDG